MIILNNFQTFQNRTLFQLFLEDNHTKQEGASKQIQVLLANRERGKKIL